MPLDNGTILGPYKITALIGTGGMGEVYKAQDSRLDRVVAVKTLQTRAKAPEELRQRFEVEARAVARLQHPNICALYDVGETGGVPYLVMEYLEGKPLSERIAEGAVPVGEALRIAAGLAAGLDAAHRAGITHRDLKPGNVVLTKTGAKLLDFGLARVMERGASHGATTMSAPITSEGTLLGTVPYMAPEQVEGRPADARTDIFALGLILYEMLTGRRAFQGETQARLMAAILREEPAALSIHPQLDRCVARCLAKDPDDRWQTARDLARELEWLAAGNTQSGAQAIAVPEPRRRWLPWAALVAALVVGAAGWAVWRPAPAASSGPVTRVGARVPKELKFFAGAALSPDGTKALAILRKCAYCADAYIYHLADGTFRAVPGTETVAGWGTWSPDGNSIAYYHANGLRRLDLVSGATLELSREGHPLRPITWSSDGFLLITSRSNQILKLPETGGPATAVWQGTVDVVGLQAIPGTDKFLIADREGQGGEVITRLASFGAKTGELVVRADGPAILTGGDRVIYRSGSNLVAQYVDRRSLKPIGDVVALARNVDFSAGVLYDAKETGTIVYVPGLMRRKSRLVWFDRSGKEVGEIGEPGPLMGPVLSPDGSKVVYAEGEQFRNRDLWLYDLKRDVRMRLTDDPRDDAAPLWSPDGKYVYFVSRRKGSGDIYRKSVSAGLPEELILGAADKDEVPSGISPDGKLLWFSVGAGRFVLDLESRQVRQVSVAEQGGRYSPDGRWVLVRRANSGGEAIFLQSVSQPENNQLVSAFGGESGHWRGDGREILYAERNAIMAVDVDLTATPPRLGRPRQLFTREVPAGPFQSGFAVTGDGQRFLMPVPIVEEQLPDLELLVNWPRLLQK